MQSIKLILRVIALINFEQLTDTRIVTKYRRGHPVRAFEKISGRRNETLDTLTYAFAARHLVNIDLTRRALDLKHSESSVNRPVVYKSKWLNRLL